MNNDRKRGVIVLGAGLSGMAVAHELRSRGIPVTLLEANERVAAPWRARHPQLRLNIHRHYASLPGKQMTREDGIFVSRDTVVEFLEAYSESLEGVIRFGVTASRVQPELDGWRVFTNAGDFTAEHLVVATGREQTPDMPTWPGADVFRGEIVHAADFGNVKRYDGKKVLVVGAGNSGTDVLNHLARNSAAKIWVSLRHGPSILPSRIFGFSLQRLAGLFLWFPKWSLDPLFTATQWAFFGNLKRYGLRRHALGGNTRMAQEGVTFALDDGFVAALKKGKVEAVAETVGFTEDKVQLSDGRKLDADVVICATGYRAGLEPLFGHLGVLNASGYPYKSAAEPDRRHPGLWFVGYQLHLKGFFYSASECASRIARAIDAAGKKSLAVNHVTYAAADSGDKARKASGVNDDAYPVEISSPNTPGIAQDV